MFLMIMFIFFFNDTATTEIYTLSLHDALPIFHLGDPQVLDVHVGRRQREHGLPRAELPLRQQVANRLDEEVRSEEHTSELQSLAYLVCRLLLEKKKTKITYNSHH